MRHATAQHPDEAAQDRLRELTPQGREEARTAGLALRALGEPIALILTSPYVRALRTGELVREALGSSPVLEAREELASGASLQALFDAGAAGCGRGVLIVGHNPELSAFAGASLTPATVCRLDLDDQGRRRLAWRRTPSELAELARSLPQ